LPIQLSRLSGFRKSHVASFQGRVACRFYPLEGLSNSPGAFLVFADMMQLEQQELNLSKNILAFIPVFIHGLFTAN